MLQTLLTSLRLTTALRLFERIATLHLIRVESTSLNRRLVMDQEAAAMAGWALLREGLHQALAHALTRHLNQAQRGDLSNLMLRAVASQAFNEAAQHEVAVLLHHHVHKVDHDHAADITQTQLADDLLSGLQVAASDRFLQRLALADEAAGVHVDGGHSLGTVDHQRAAAWQIDLAFHALAQLGIDIPLVEDVSTLMLGWVPLLQAWQQFRAHLLEVAMDAVVDVLAFDDKLAEVIVEDVAHHADGDVRFRVQDMRAMRVLELVVTLLNAFPAFEQQLQVGFDGFLAGSLCCRADDDAHILRGDGLDDALEAQALARGELTRHAGHSAAWHEHDVAASQSNLAGQAGTLVANRILGDLHEHRVARMVGALNAASFTFQLRVIPVDFACVENAITRFTNVDEGCLHARQNVLDAANVDVAHGRHFLDVGNVVLDEDVVLDDGDLGVVALFAHDHLAVDVFTACQEVLLDDEIVLAASSARVTTVATLGLQAGRALHVLDARNIGLLALGVGCWQWLHRVARLWQGETVGTVARSGAQDGRFAGLVALVTACAVGAALGAAGCPVGASPATAASDAFFAIFLVFLLLPLLTLLLARCSASLTPGLNFLKAPTAMARWCGALFVKVWLKITSVVFAVRTLATPTYADSALAFSCFAVMFVIIACCSDCA